MKNILVTGASGGFGKLIVESLLGKGYNVIASMRDVGSRNKKASEELASIGARIVEIDVTNDSSVDEVLAQVIRETGGIDILINNAGLGTLGIQEAYTPDDWQKIFEINVFGVQRMIRAVLPQMRKQNSGLLILVSSLTGQTCYSFSRSLWSIKMGSRSIGRKLSD